MSSPSASDVKVFVPAKDFNRSLAFYEALGWNTIWRAEDDRLALIELAGSRSYLQNYYNKEWADNFMLHIAVDDAEAWHEHAANVIEEGRFSDCRVDGPREEDYGALVTYVWDPSGVLLHFAKFHGERTML